METEIKKALQTLKNGGLLLYPTDTVWGIGCDATTPKAVQKTYALKKRPGHKAMICLVADKTMLRKYVKTVPKPVSNLLDTTERPTTVIYKNPEGVADNLIGDDNTLAIRICKDEFCYRLIKQFNKPLVSTSANFTGQATPKTFNQIHPEIRIGVDYVVNLPLMDLNARPSKIIKVEETGVIEIIRE